MGQGGGLVVMTADEVAEGQRLGAEPGACGARERSRATNRAAVRCLWDWASGEIVPSGGTGPGLSVPCDRSDCEWVNEGLRPVSERSTMMTGTPCPRWVRLASEDAEKERVRLARLVTYPDTLTGPYTREEAVAQAGLWWARRADFRFAGLGEMHDRMDHKIDVPAGASVFALFEFRGDGRAWISLDGNWNHDAVPIEPPMTYDEAFTFLSGCSVAPPWRGRCEKVDPNAKPVGYGSKRDMDRGLTSHKACVVRGLHLTATGD